MSKAEGKALCPPPGLLLLPGRDAVSQEICHFHHCQCFPLVTPVSQGDHLSAGLVTSSKCLSYKRRNDFPAARWPWGQTPPTGWQQGPRGGCPGPRALGQGHIRTVHQAPTPEPVTDFRVLWSPHHKSRHLLWEQLPRRMGTMLGDQGWPHKTRSCTELHKEPNADSFSLWTPNAAASGSLIGNLPGWSPGLGECEIGLGRGRGCELVFTQLPGRQHQGEDTLPWLHLLLQKTNQGTFFFQHCRAFQKAQASEPTCKTGGWVGDLEAPAALESLGLSSGPAGGHRSRQQPRLGRPLRSAHPILTPRPLHGSLNTWPRKHLDCWREVGMGLWAEVHIWLYFLAQITHGHVEQGSRHQNPHRLDAPHYSRSREFCPVLPLTSDAFQSLYLPWGWSGSR